MLLKTHEDTDYSGAPDQEYQPLSAFRMYAYARGYGYLCSKYQENPQTQMRGEPFRSLIGGFTL